MSACNAFGFIFFAPLLLLPLLQLAAAAQRAAELDLLTGGYAAFWCWCCGSRALGRGTQLLCLACALFGIAYYMPRVCLPGFVFSLQTNWKQIAAEVKTRNHVQCLQRYRKVLAPGLVKGQWTPQEDQLLLSVVNDGHKNWGSLSKQIPGRTSKQVRWGRCQLYRVHNPCRVLPCFRSRSIWVQNIIR